MSTYIGTYNIPFKVYMDEAGFHYLENDDFYSGADENIRMKPSCLSKYERIEEPLEFCFCGRQPKLVIDVVDGVNSYHYRCTCLSTKDSFLHFIRSECSRDKKEAGDLWNSLMLTIKKP